MGSRIRSLGAAVTALLVLLTGCLTGCREAEPPKYYLVSLTVESLNPNLHSWVDISYTDENGKSVDFRSDGAFRSWGVDQRMHYARAVGVQAEFPDQTGTIRVSAELRCTIAVNGVVVAVHEFDGQCVAATSMINFTGPPSAPATLSPRPPATWPPFTTAPAPKPKPTAAKPRPAQCKYATDAQIREAVGASKPSMWEFKGVTVGLSGGCLYKFGPILPGDFYDPLSGVTVVFYPGLVGEANAGDEKIPGLSPARRSSDSIVWANLPRGYLMIIAQFPDEATRRTVSESVYKVVRRLV